MRFKVYFQMSLNLYNAEIDEEKHLITLDTIEQKGLYYNDAKI